MKLLKHPKEKRDKKRERKRKPNSYGHQTGGSKSRSPSSGS